MQPGTTTTCVHFNIQAINCGLFVADDRLTWMYSPAGAVMPHYYNVGMYYYSPWQPVYYVGRTGTTATRQKVSCNKLYYNRNLLRKFMKCSMLV